MRFFTRPAFVGLLLLAACGFSPIYGHRGAENGKPVAAALGNVFIENIPDETGQKLRNKLMDRLYFHGRPAAPEARLSVSLTATEAAMGIQKDATASLSELTLSASYRLNGKNGQKLLTGAAQSAVIYSKLDAQYGTLAAQRNAYDRAINEVCEQIVARLSLFYAETPPSGAVTPETSWALKTSAVRK